MNVIEDKRLDAVGMSGKEIPLTAKLADYNKGMERLVTSSTRPVIAHDVDVPVKELRNEPVREWREIKKI